MTFSFHCLEQWEVHSLVAVQLCQKEAHLGAHLLWGQDKSGVDKMSSYGRSSGNQ
jgi:hypothetical protein